MEVGQQFGRPPEVEPANQPHPKRGGPGRSLSPVCTLGAPPVRIPLGSPPVWESGMHETLVCSLPAQSDGGCVSSFLMARGTQSRPRVPSNMFFRKQAQLILHYWIGLRTSSDGEEDVLCSGRGSRDKVAHLKKMETPSFSPCLPCPRGSA